MAEWLDVRRLENWGAVTGYTTDPPHVEPYHEPGVPYTYVRPPAPSRLDLTEGQLVTVKFRDDTTDTLPLVSRRRRVSVGDHGLTYDVESKELGVTIEARGHPLFVELSDLRLEVNRG